MATLKPSANRSPVMPNIMPFLETALRSFLHAIATAQRLVKFANTIAETSSPMAT